MAQTDQDFEMYQGDDFSIEFETVDEAGAALDISGATIEWNAWDRGVSVLKKTTTSGISITDGPGGIFVVTLEPTDTYSLPAKTYFHGANVSLIADHFLTVATGIMTLRPKVRT